VEGGMMPEFDIAVERSGSAWNDASSKDESG